MLSCLKVELYNDYKEKKDWSEAWALSQSCLVEGLPDCVVEFERQFSV